MKVDCLSVSSKPYADTIRTYLVYPEEYEGMSDDEIIKAVKTHFDVGEKWYENKLELFRPSYDGCSFTVKIREPYCD